MALQYSKLGGFVVIRGTPIKIFPLTQVARRTCHLRLTLVLPSSSCSASYALSTSANGLMDRKLKHDFDHTHVRKSRGTDFLQNAGLGICNLRA